jgi:hypothetical protein
MVDVKINLITYESKYKDKDVKIFDFSFKISTNSVLKVSIILHDLKINIIDGKIKLDTKSDKLIDD